MSMRPQIVSAAAFLFVLVYIFQCGGLFILFEVFIISEAGFLFYFRQIKRSMRGFKLGEDGPENQIIKFTWPYYMNISTYNSYSLSIHGS